MVKTLEKLCYSKFTETIEKAPSQIQKLLLGETRRKMEKNIENKITEKITTNITEILNDIIPEILEDIRGRPIEADSNKTFEAPSLYDVETTHVLFLIMGLTSLLNLKYLKLYFFFKLSKKLLVTPFFILSTHSPIV